MTSEAAAAGSRPVLGVLPNMRSPMELARAAAGVCDLVWIVDSGDDRQPVVPRLLRKLGTVVDIVGMSEDEAADALRPCHLDGIIAYADYIMSRASALASRLGLDFHDEVVTERIVDKLPQRTALRDGGLPVPRFVVVAPEPTSEELDAVVQSVEFPVVVKPRHGATSRDTVLAHDAAELRKQLAAPPSVGSDPTKLVEEFLVGATPPPSPHLADYCSVESVVCAGQISHVAVTGRFWPAEPFRETGMILPSDYEPPVVKAVLDVATRAISAVGVRIGFLHTEIKITPDGPRVLEVNGRLGGGVPEMLALAAGLDLYQMSFRVALGERIVFDELVPTDRVGYLICRQPPQWARRVVSVESLDAVAEYPGVQAVSLNRQPGDEVDWRKGSHQYIFTVIGAAPDHEGVLAVRQLAEEGVQITYA
ncbi:MAG: ATP-grasp domain-containing protein [Acidimicrobiales bacterium]